MKFPTKAMEAKTIIVILIPSRNERFLILFLIERLSIVCNHAITH